MQCTIASYCRVKVSGLVKERTSGLTKWEVLDLLNALRLGLPG